MSSKRYTDEYKAEAVKQVLGRGHMVTEVAARLRINKHSLYEHVKQAKAHRGDRVQSVVGAHGFLGGDDAGAIATAGARQRQAIRRPGDNSKVRTALRRIAGNEMASSSTLDPMTRSALRAAGNDLCHFTFVERNQPRVD